MNSKRDEILNYILTLEKSYRNNNDLMLDQLLPFGKDEYVPNVTIQVTNPKVISELRNKSDIRYVEPEGYYFQSQIVNRSSSGCGDNPDYGCYFSGKYVANGSYYGSYSSSCIRTM